MDLIEAKISEIKNLRLVDIYAIDNVFKNDANKYVGIRIVYNKNKVYELDYRSVHFSKLLKKVVEVYNQEKEHNNIILLGDMTKKVINDYQIIDKNTTYNNSLITKSILPIPKHNIIINMYSAIIENIIYSLLMFYKNYEFLQDIELTGFGTHYNATYKVGSVTKSLPLIIYFDELNNINILISDIDSVLCDIKIIINNSKTNLNATWKNEYDNTKGVYYFDTLTYKKYISIYNDNNILYHMEIDNDINREEIDKINYYLSILGLSLNNNVIKLGTNTYMLTESNTTLLNETDSLYEEVRHIIHFNGELVSYEVIRQQGLSKYNNEINVLLEEEKDEVLFMPFMIYDKKYLIIEDNRVRYGLDNYNYQLYEYDINNNLIDTKIDNTKVKSLTNIKSMIRNGGDVDGDI